MLILWIYSISRSFQLIEVGYILLILLIHSLYKRSFQRLRVSDIMLVLWMHSLSRRNVQLIEVGHNVSSMDAVPFEK